MGDQDQAFSITDLSGGLNSQDHPTRISDNEVPDILNWDLDDGSWQKRLGFRQYNSTALNDEPISGEGFETTDGTKRLVVQVNHSATTSGAAEERSLLYVSTGNGTFTPVAWYATGTCTTDGTSAVTTAGGTNIAVNLDGSDALYWFGKGSSPTKWYRINSVAAGTNATITLDAAFAEANSTDSYMIVRPFSASVECYYKEAVNRLVICQSGQRPQRYDGTTAEFLENIPVATGTSTAASASGSLMGNTTYYIQLIHEYAGGLGKSKPLTNALSQATTGSNKTIDLSSIPRGPDGVQNIEIYITRSGGSSTGPFYYSQEISNGTTTASITAEPSTTAAQLEFDNAAIDEGRTAPVNGKYVHFLDERLWITDTANNPSTVTVSKPFAIGEFPTANTYVVSRNDGQQISGLYDSYGRLIIFKDESAFYLTENSMRGQVVKIEGDIGCVSQKTIDRMGTNLIFLSRRGVAMGDTRGFQIVSRKILRELLATKQIVIRHGKFTLTTKTEWDTGTHGSQSSTASSTSSTVDGDVTVDNVSAAPIADTSAGDWTGANDILVDVTNDRAFASNYEDANSLYLDQVTTVSPSMIRDMFIVDGSITATNWTNPTNTRDGSATTYAYIASGDVAVSSGSYSSTITNPHESFIAGADYRCNKIVVVWALIGADDNRVLSGVRTQTYSFPTAETDGVRVSFAVDTSIETIRMRVHRRNDPGNYFLVGDDFRDYRASNSGETVRIALYRVSIYEAGFEPYGYYVNDVVDMGVSQPGLGTVSWTEAQSFYDGNTGNFIPNGTTDNGDTASGANSSGSGTLTVYVATGTDDPGGEAAGTTNWSPWTLQTNGQAFAATQGATPSYRRYVQYKVEFRSNYASVTPRLDDLTINVTRPAVYTSPEIDTTTSNVKWGRFLYDLDAAGYTVQARYIQGAAPGLGTPSTNLSSGDIVNTSTVNRYVKFDFTFTPGTTPATSSAIAPLLHAMTVEWLNSTSPSAGYPAVGKVFRDKYYLSLERSQTAYNDRVYVMNERGAWTKYDWALNGFIVSGNVFYGLSSNTTSPYTARCYYLLDGYTDDGTAIRSFLKFKPYVNGPNDKIFKRVWIEAEVANGSNNTLTLRVGPVQSYSVTLATLGVGSAYATTGLETAGNMSTPDNQAIAGYAGPVAVTQTAATADYRFNYRGNFFMGQLTHNAANADIIRVMRVDVTFYSKRLRGIAV